MVTYPLPLTRDEAGSGKGVSDYAEASFGGVLYASRTRRGACSALARQLVEAGAPDVAVEMVRKDGSPSMRCSSLHGLARTTLEESSGSKLRRVRYREYVRDMRELEDAA